MAGRFWLMKSEPDVFSIDDLKKKKKAPWDGVRNYQARNYMQSMQVGDRVLFYHSSCAPPGVAGTAKVCKQAYPDHTAWNPSSDYFDPKSSPDRPRWFMVDLEYVETFRNFVPLDALRNHPELAEMAVLRRGQRLSVQPVTTSEFRVVCHLGGTKLKT